MLVNFANSPAGGAGELAFFLLGLRRCGRPVRSAGAVGRCGWSCRLGHRALLTPLGASVRVWAAVARQSRCLAGYGFGEVSLCLSVPAGVAVDAHTPDRRPGGSAKKRTRSAAVHRLPGGEALDVRIPEAIVSSSQHRADRGRLCPFSSAEPGPPGTHLQWRQRAGQQAPGSTPLSWIPGIGTSRSASCKRSTAIQSRIHNAKVRARRAALRPLVRLVTRDSPAKRSILGVLQFLNRARSTTV